MRTVVYLSARIVLFFFPTPLLAQVHIKGKVVNDSSGIGLSFADVSVFNGKGKELTKKYCDSLGYFDIDIKTAVISAGMVLRASYLKDSSAAVLFDPGNVLDHYLLRIRSVGLDAAVVGKSRKPLIEKKVDRIIYNIEGYALFENRSITDILKNIPRINISRNSITITGKGTVLVMINDHVIYLDGKDLIDYLSLYKDDIISIEVIPDPPAKYDAAGGGGLLNIVTKKGKVRGIFGDLNLSLVRNSYLENDGNLNLHYRNKNLNIMVSAGYSAGSYKEVVVNNYLFSDPAVTSWQSNADNRVDYHGLKGSVLIEYTLSRKSSLNLNYNWTLNQFTDHQYQLINYYNAAVLDSVGIAGGRDDTRSVVQTAGANLHFDIAKTKKLDFYVDYVNRGNDETDTMLTLNYWPNEKTLSGFQTGLYSLGNSPKSLFSGRVDFALPTWFWQTTVEVGLKYSDYNNHSRIAFDQTANGISIFKGIDTRDTFRYRERDPAAYISLDRKFGRLAVKAGLRYEGTYTVGNSTSTGEDNHNQYTDVFPSGFLQYRFNDDWSVDGAYSRRINRPRIWDVNPYRWYQTNLAYSVGNPRLAPSLQDNMDVNVFFKNRFIINGYYNIQHSPIVSLPMATGDTISTIKSNKGTIFNYGINLDANFILWKYLTNAWSFSLGGYSYVTTYSFNYQRAPLIASLALHESYEFSRILSADLDFRGTLPGGGINIATQTGSYDVGFSLRKSLDKGKLVIVLSASDIFRSSSPTYLTKTPAFTSSIYNYYDFRSVSVNLKYKFGKEIRSVKKKTGLQTSERMRL